MTEGNDVSHLCSDHATVSGAQVLLIQSKFVELSELFQELCIPYLLTTIDEKGFEKMDKSEKVELDGKYEQFKLKIGILIRLTQTSLIKSKNSVLEHNFVNHIDSHLYEAIKIFEDLDKTNQLRIEKIQDAYSAFIRLARLLNTSIKLYNDNHPSNKIAQLHNIPDPQFYEINDILLETSADTSRLYLIEQTIEKYQKLGFLQGNILSDAKLKRLKELLEKRDKFVID